MRARCFIAATAASVLLVNRSALADVKLGTVQSTCSTVKRFERCELTAHVSGPIKNPYDPEEVALDATFSPAQGHPVTVPGFYYQPFERVMDGGRETLRQTGEPVWKVRFTPRQVGRWTYTVKLSTPKGAQTSSGGPFLVVESSHPGFLGVDRRSGYLRFDTGVSFVPIGENLCWGPSVQPLQAYERWFHDLIKQHANYIRLWMAPWGFRLETKDTGVGRYDQLRAWELDDLLEHSEAAGLYWQLCLLNHGSFSRSQDPDWHNNPYNESLGGMCRLPNEFLTSSMAKTLFQRLLRYIVARWGYSPNLAMWEIFNESDFGEFRADDFTVWLAQTTTFLRSIDVNHHPITTSFHKEAPTGVWQLPMMDTIQLHVYDLRDFPSFFGGSAIEELKQAFHKPVFIGEFGWIQEMVRKLDESGIHVHDGLWSSLMGGAAGGALVWYWDSYVHPHHLERHLRALEAFWRGEQLQPQSTHVKLSFSDADLVGWSVGTPQRTYLWIKNRTHSIDQYLAYRCELAKQRLRQTRGETPEVVHYPPRKVQGATATVHGVDWLARYRIEWWDPYRGRIIARAVHQAKGNTLTVEVPTVKFDLAGKLIKLEWWERG